MEPDLSKYVLAGDNSRYASASGAGRPRGHAGGARARQHRPVRRRHPHLRRERPAHPGHPDLVRPGAQRGGVPLGAASPRRGRDRRLRAVRPRADLLRREVRRLHRHGGRRLGVRPAVPAARRVQPRPRAAADLDDRAHPGEHRGQPAAGRTTASCRTGWSARDARRPPRSSPTRSRSSRPTPSGSTSPSPPSPSRAPGPRRTAATWSPRRRWPRSGPSTTARRCTRCTPTSCDPADIGAEVRYEVEMLRDGRGYSTRQVRAFQRGKADLRLPRQLRRRRAGRGVRGGVPGAASRDRRRCRARRSTWPGASAAR